MPELPEVETFRSFFDSIMIDKLISDVEVLDENILKDISSNDFKKMFPSLKFLKTDRWGKFMFAHLSNKKIIVFHFGMTGDFNYIENYRGKTDLETHDRILFFLENGDVFTYFSQRKLGFVSITSNIEQFMVKKKFGPDILTISKEDFYNRMHKRKRPIKSALLEQSITSGIGNLYADETLFQMNIHPQTITNTLSQILLEKMHEKITDILFLAIENKANYGKFPKNFFIHCRKKGEKCPKCDTILKSVKITGRTSFFCPQCQKIA